MSNQSKIDKIFLELEKVEDPELGVDIVNLGLVYGVELNKEQTEVDIKMTLTSPICPLSDQIEQQAKLAAMQVVPIVRIEWVWTPAWDKSRMSQMALEQLSAMGY